MSLSNDLQERDGLIKHLNIRLASADSSLETLTNDLNYFRAQYSEARDRVIAEEERTTELESLLGTLRGQLTLGLKQRDMHYDAVRGHRADELERYRVRNKLLLDQARLTDDGIRYKAALYEVMRKENHQLKDKTRKDRYKIKKFRNRIEELRDQLQMMRAREMGIFEVSGYASMDTSTDTEDSKSSLSGEEHYTPSAVINSLDDLYSSSQVLPEMSLISGRPVVARMEFEGNDMESIECVVEGGSGTRCKWREEGAQCTVLLETFQVCPVLSLLMVLRD